MENRRDVADWAVLLEPAHAELRALFGERFDVALAPCMAAIRGRMEGTGERTLLAAIRLAGLPGMHGLMSRMYLAAGMEMVCR